MKTKACLLLLFCLSVQVKSQQSTFSKRLLDTLENGIVAKTVVPAADNGFIIAGGFSNGYGLIFKLDSLGNLKWNKTFVNPPSGYPDVYFNSLIATNDSCYAVAGSISNGAGGKAEALIIKFLPNGDTLWSRTIGNNTRDIAIVDMHQTFDSGYVMTGMYGSDSAVFVAKLSYTGALQWSASYKSSMYNIGQSIRQTPDSGYILSGWSEYYPAYDYAFLLKLSTTGLVEWAKKFKYLATSPMTGYDVELCPGGYMLYLNTPGVDVLAKTNLTGDVIWAKSVYQFSGTYNLSSPSPKLHKTSDNSYIFVSKGTWHQPGTLTKVDTAGNAGFVSFIEMSPAEVVECTDKGLFIVGNGPMFGSKTATTSPQVGIIKADSLGAGLQCIIPVSTNSNTISLPDSIETFVKGAGGIIMQSHPQISSILITSRDGCVDFFGAIEDISDNKSIMVYPNPSKGTFTLRCNESTKAKIIIYNVFGVKISENNIFFPETFLDLTKQHVGIYYYRALTESGRTFTGKLAIVK